MADFLSDVGASDDDGELPSPGAMMIQRAPEPEPEKEPELETETELVPEEETVAGTLLAALARRSGANSWLSACERLAELGASDPTTAEFKRRGGMKLLTALLGDVTADTGIDEQLIEAVASAIASCSGTTARPQQRTFRLSEVSPGRTDCTMSCQCV